MTSIQLFLYLACLLRIDGDVLGVLSKISVFQPQGPGFVSFWWNANYLSLMCSSEIGITFDFQHTTATSPIRSIFKVRRDDFLTMLKCWPVKTQKMLRSSFSGINYGPGLDHIARMPDERPAKTLPHGKIARGSRKVDRPFLDLRTH